MARSDAAAITSCMSMEMTLSTREPLSLWLKPPLKYKGLLLQGLAPRHPLSQELPDAKMGGFVQAKAAKEHQGAFCCSRKEQVCVG